MITVMMKVMVMVMVMVMVIITVMMMVMVLARISNVLMPCYLCPSHYLQQANTHIRFLRLPITKYFALFPFLLSNDDDHYNDLQTDLSGPWSPL